jgi:hypothetical protein
MSESRAMVSDEVTGTEPVEVETAVLAARTEHLAPLYDAAIRTFVWGFRLGAALLALGIGMALVKGEPLGREADPISGVLAEVLAGNASGIIDLAILWFMLTPVAATIVAGGPAVRVAVAGGAGHSWGEYCAGVESLGSGWRPCHAASELSEASRLQERSVRRREDAPLTLRMTRPLLVTLALNLRRRFHVE